jgi:hypothetical protein
MPDIKLLDPPAEDTQTEVKPLPGYRDEGQRHFDGVFKELHERWQKHGKPAPEARNAQTWRGRVAKKEVSTLKAMLRSAATHSKSDIRFYRDAKHEDGSVTVKVTPADKPAPATTPPANQG